MIGTVAGIEAEIIQENDNQPGPGWQAFNEENYMTMILVSFIMFEGIPAVLPIMEASEAKENFSYILSGALAVLLIINIAFAELCYYCYGDTLTEPLVMEMIPEDQPALVAANVFYVMMLVLSYPLVIYTTNRVAEYNLFRRMEHGSLRYWLKNFSRTVVCTVGTLIAVTCYEHLHVIKGLIGVILGGTVVVIVPSMIHNKLVA